MLRSDKERYRHEIIRSLFTTAFAIITEINQRDRKNETEARAAARCFQRVHGPCCSSTASAERNVSFYARQLNITPKYLSSVVKEVSGKTAARWIDESVILEAKAQVFRHEHIQEIAYHLNFSTQSFFGKYFKQHTGTSPSRYKGKHSFRFYRALFSPALVRPETENTFVCPGSVEPCQDKIRSSKIKKPNLVFQVAARGCPL